MICNWNSVKFGTDFERSASAFDSRSKYRLYTDRQRKVSGGALSFEKGMEIEYESAVNLAGTRDFSEGIQAFLEKRKPDWD